MKYLLLIFLFGACVHYDRPFENNVAQSKEGNLESKLSWVKIKDGKIDLSITVENKSDKPVFMEQNAVRVIYGGVKSSGSIHGNQGQVIPEQSRVSEVITVSFSENFESLSKGQVILSPFYVYEGGKKGKTLGKLIHDFEVSQEYIDQRRSRNQKEEH